MRVSSFSHATRCKRGKRYAAVPSIHPLVCLSVSLYVTLLYNVETARQTTLYFYVVLAASFYTVFQKQHVDGSVYNYCKSTFGRK